MTRRFIAYVATSADGFIARPDGDVHWLDRAAGDPEGYGYAEFAAGIDTVVMGRKTWETGVALGQPSYPGKANWVFTRSPGALAGAGVRFTSEDVATFARRLRAEPGADVWVVGGAELIAAFLDAGELDELFVHVVPMLIGEGIPLVAPRHREVPLALLETRAFPDGVVRVRWEARRRTEPHAR